jgi:rhomboid family GlyGly-CTERM serine protease
VAQPKKIGVRIPAVTCSLLGLSLLVYGFPQASDLLAFDRAAVLQGELWRLVTAPFVHFSASHLFWNILVLCAAGWAAEAAGQRGFRWVCMIACAIPGPLYLLAFPEIGRYGGLSGLATGAAAYFCLCRALESKRNRTLWWIILFLMGAKIIVEAALGASLFVRAGGMPFRALPSAHVVGYLGALATFCVTRPAGRPRVPEDGPLPQFRRAESR